MKALFFGLLILICATTFAQTDHAPSLVKIKIDAPALDSASLLAKLNDHGADHRMKFEAADEGYVYRIEFDTFQHRNSAATLAGAGAVHFSGAEAKVYDNQGKLVFEFSRETRYTDAGATNAVAKEVIKRLLQWQHEQAKEKSR
jgi:hypothetical protein